MQTGGVVPILRVAFVNGMYDASPTYVNVFPDVMSITVERGGQPYSTSAEAGKLVVTLNNESGVYHPKNAAGPYFRNLTKNKRVQLIGYVDAEYGVLDGYSASWEPEAAVGQPKTCTLTVYDPLWIPARTKLLGIGFDRYVKALSPTPTAYYRLGDKDTPTTAYDEMGLINAAYVGTPRQRTAGALIADSNAGADLGNLERCLVIPMAVDQANESAIAAFINPSEYPPAVSSRIVLGSFGPAVGTDDAYIRISDTGKIAHIVRSTGSATPGIGVSVGVVPLNRWSLLALCHIATGWIMVFVTDDLTVEIIGPFNPGSPTKVNPTICIGGFPSSTGHTTSFAGAIDETVVWIGSSPTVTDWFNNKMLSLQAFKPGKNDIPSTRLSDLLDQIEWPSSRRSVTVANHIDAVKMNPYTSVPGANVIDPIRTLAESYSADLYADRTGNIVYTGYQWPEASPTPVMTVTDDPDSPNPKYSALVTVLGEEDKKTRVIGSDGIQQAFVDDPDADGSDAEDAVSTFPGLYTDLVYDATFRRSRRVFDPDERVAPVVLRLASPTMTDAHRVAVLSLELGDVIAVEQAGDTLYGKIVRIAHDVSQVHWDVSVSTESLPKAFTAGMRATAVAQQTGNTSTAQMTPGEIADTGGMHRSAYTNDPLLAVSAGVELANDTVYLAVLQVKWTSGSAGIYDLKFSIGASGTRIAFQTGTATAGMSHQVGVLWKAGSPALGSPDILNPIAGKASGAGSDNLESTLAIDGISKYAPILAAVMLRPGTHSFSGRDTGTHTIASGTHSLHTMDLERWDNGGMHPSGANWRMNAIRNGTYFAASTVSFVANATGQRWGSLRLNGTTIIGVNSTRAATSGTTKVQGTALWKMTAGEYLEGTFGHDSGAGLDEASVSDYTGAWIVELGRSTRLTGAGQSVPNNTVTALSTPTVQWADVGAVPTNDDVTGTGDDQFDFHGTWTYDATRVTAHEGDWTYSAVTNDYFEFDFIGVQVSYCVPKQTNLGIAAVSIDGGAETNVDLYSATQNPTGIVWTSPVLAYGPHTLKVRVTGTKNGSSAGYYCAADRVDVFSEAVATDVDEDGWWLIWACVEWAANATGMRQVYLTVNGEIVVMQDVPANATGTTAQCAWTLMYMNRGDVIGSFAKQTSGGSLSITSTSYSPALAFALVPTP